MTSAIAWQDPEDTVLRERRQTQRTHSMGSTGRKCPGWVTPETGSDHRGAGLGGPGDCSQDSRGFLLGQWDVLKPAEISAANVLQATESHTPRRNARVCKSDLMLPSC